MTEEPGYLANRPHVKMISQIDKYWAKLFADPLPVQTPEGLKFIQPQRTNNIMERFFRNFDGPAKSADNPISAKFTR